MKNNNLFDDIKIGDIVAVHEAVNKKLKTIKRNRFQFGTVVAMSKKLDMVTVKFLHDVRDMRSYRIVPPHRFTDEHHKALLGVKP